MSPSFLPPPPPPEETVRPPLFTGRPRAHRAWAISALVLIAFLGTTTGLLSRGKMTAVFVPQWNRWLIADALCYGMFFSGPVLRYTFLLTQRLCQRPTLPNPLEIPKEAYGLLWEDRSMRYGAIILIGIALNILPSLSGSGHNTLILFGIPGAFAVSIALGGWIIWAILQGVRLNDETWHND